MSKRLASLVSFLGCSACVALLPAAPASAHAAHAAGKTKATTAQADPLTTTGAIQIATAEAAKIGTVEGKPEAATVTLGEALRTLMESPVAPPSGTRMAAGLNLEVSVQRVTLVGHFTAQDAREPRWATGPVSGTALEYVLGPDGEVIGRHLAKPSATAEVARRNARTSSRHKAHAASWDSGHCNNDLGHHCYNLTEWVMPGSTEKVRASETQMETTAMTVPLLGSPEQSFVDNEKWTGFPQSAENSLGHYWIEDGQEAGYPHGSEHQMYWFVAWNNGGGYGEIAGWPEEGWIFHDYQTNSQLNGSWCAYIDGGYAGCVGGLPNYAKSLEVGAEYTTPSDPSNVFNEQSNYTSVAGEVRTWNKAAAYTDPHTCQGAFSRESPPHYYPGNISGWTPC